MTLTTSIIVVPYIGTWIETNKARTILNKEKVVPYIGTWIETFVFKYEEGEGIGRTLYRYVD